MPQGREILEKKRGKKQNKKEKNNHGKALGPKVGWPEPSVTGQILQGLVGPCKEFGFHSVPDENHWRDLNRRGLRSDLGFNRSSQMLHREEFVTGEGGGRTPGERGWRHGC